MNALLERYGRFFAAILVSLMALGLAAQPVPPIANVIPRVDTMFNDILIDNYGWLRQKGDSAVLAYLEAENTYTDSVMADTKELQKKLYDEMLARIKETDLSVPARKGNYYYYHRTEQGQSYEINCRKKGSLEAPEEVILDENELAAGQEYFSMGLFKVSPDHRVLAYATDTAGNERLRLRFKDLTSGQLRPDLIDNVAAGGAWAGDNATFFYMTQDELGRPYRLHRHVLGTDPATDALVYQEDDDAFYLDVQRSRDGRFILLVLGSQVTSEVRYLDAARPKDEFRTIRPRQNGVEYYVEHHDNRFFILTNDSAVTFRIVTAPSDGDASVWSEFQAPSDTLTLTGVDAFRDHLVVGYRASGLPHLRVIRLADRQTHDIAFPDAVYGVFLSDNREFNTDTLRFRYFSMVTPASVFDYDMNGRQRELKKQTEVIGYDAAQYVTERLWATAPDGARVPISLVYRKGLKMDGRNPCLLYGYGAYGLNTDPYFMSEELSLLDRGFVWATAHVRGGAEMGRQWYESGKKLYKKNTVTDYLACAEYLIDQKYTSPAFLVGEGASAGGLLIGSAINMRPDLFKAALALHPFVDLINTMKDTSIALTEIEWDEWGNPNLAEYYSYMRSYSPYDNVTAQTYPHLLIQGGYNDPRVAYWEPAKWAARLRATKTDTKLLLLRTDMGYGHFGASGRYKGLEESAFNFAFILKALGKPSD